MAPLFCCWVAGLGASVSAGTVSITPGGEPGQISVKIEDATVAELLEALRKRYDLEVEGALDGAGPGRLSGEWRGSLAQILQRTLKYANYVLVSGGAPGDPPRRVVLFPSSPASPPGPPTTTVADSRAAVRQGADGAAPAQPMPPAAVAAPPAKPETRPDAGVPAIVEPRQAQTGASAPNLAADSGGTFPADQQAPGAPAPIAAQVVPSPEEMSRMARQAQTNVEELAQRLKQLPAR
jgi:hypothetical protein